MTLGQSRPALTFFFPYHEVSGVPMLFSRMAVHLAKSGVDVRVVDYPDGAMAQRVRDVAGVRLIPFHDGVPVEIGDDSVLVMQAILPATIRPELRVDRRTRVLFWVLHPANLVQTAVPLRYFRDLQLRSRGFHAAVNLAMRPFARRLRAFVETLAARRAIVFMDGENYRLTSERTGAAIPDPLFIPVPSDSPTINRGIERKGNGNDPLTFAWLGRLADFKIHILIHLLERLSELSRRRSLPIDFHIIGHGPDAGLIRPERLEHEHFRLRMTGRLTGEALDEHLARSVDVLAGMGTSALEGARLGVPTILLDISYRRVREGYIFRWLHETTDFTLGEVLTPRHFRPGNDSLERMVDEVIAARPSLSARAFDYYVRSHSLEAIAPRFLAAASSSEFRFGEIDPALRTRSAVRRAYEWLRSRRRRNQSRAGDGVRAC